MSSWRSSSSRSSWTTVLSMTPPSLNSERNISLMLASTAATARMYADSAYLVRVGPVTSCVVLGCARPKRYRMRTSRMKSHETEEAALLGTSPLAIRSQLNTHAPIARSRRVVRRRSPSKLHHRLSALFIAAHAAFCTAFHGVGATPNPSGANIGLAWNIARHSPSAT